MELFTDIKYKTFILSYDELHNMIMKILDDDDSVDKKIIIENILKDHKNSINRLEVISNQRDYVNSKISELSPSLQDDNKTLKLFIRNSDKKI